MEKRREGEFVFAGAKQGRPLSNMAMLKLARGMGFGHVTPHGFQSTFKDYCRDELGEAECPDRLSEAILAHESGDKVLRAYARTEALKLRRKVMEAWAGYCLPPRARNQTGSRNVIPLKSARGNINFWGRQCPSPPRVE
jgi:integrase